MTRRLSLSFLAIAVLALIALPISAKPNSNGTIKASINLASPAKVGSITLAAGWYDVVAEGTQVKFERNGKTIVEAPCTLKDLSSKSQSTGFQIDRDQVTEINVAGKTQAIELSAASASGN